MSVNILPRGSLEVTKCKMCNKEFPKNLLYRGKCFECNKLLKEWQNGRAKTKEEKALYKNVSVSYAIPSYKRVYSVYQFNQQKYNKIFKKVQALAFKYGAHIHDKAQRYKVLELCYCRREGKRVHLGDEKHIFRYKALHNICDCVASELRERHNLLIREDVLSYLYKRTGLIYYFDCLGESAELKQAIRKPLKERIKIAIRLLRGLRDKALSIEQATAYAIEI